MSGFLREHSWPIAFSVLLHGLVAAAFAFAALISITRAPPHLEPLPIDAIVIDSQVLHAAQRALAERAEQETARVKAAADAKAAAEQTAIELKHAEEEARAADAAKAADAVKQAAQAKLAADANAAKVAAAADAQKLAAAKRAEELKRVDDQKRIDDAKRLQDAKRAEDAKQAEDAKRAADLKAKSEREAELKRQLADEEHVSAVEASPARAQYIARLASRIQNAWIKPPSARAGLDCVVNITQIPGGEVTSAHVSQCNGDAAARQSIENAVYRASPLPAPPDPALFERNLVIHFHPEE
jgi:colicin import membrane protein